MSVNLGVLDMKNLETKGVPGTKKVGTPVLRVTVIKK